MADEYVKLVKIGLDQSIINASIANADKLTAEIKALTAAQKESGIQDAETTGKIKALTQERNKNIEVIKQANILTKAEIDSNEELKAQLSLLTAQYNKLSKEEKENTEAGQQMGKTIRSISDELKENEKAVGDNRRNVGNYEDAIKKLTGGLKIAGVSVSDLADNLNEQKDAAGGAAGGATSFGKTLGGVASGLRTATIEGLKFIATPIGAVLAGIALTIGLLVGGFKLMAASLNRTEEGSAALSSVLNTFKGILGGVLEVIQPIAMFLVEGLAKGFEALGAIVEKTSKAIQSAMRFVGLDAAAASLGNVTTKIKETAVATAQLAKAEAELNAIQRQQGKLQLEFQSRAEKLRQARDDESKSMKERIQSNKDLGDVLTEQSNAEMKLAKRALQIANLRIKADGASTENLNKKAEAELKIAEIEERLTSQRSEQLTNENSLIREGLAIAKAASAERSKIAKEATEAAKKLSEEQEKAEKERLRAIDQAFIDERDLIDQMAETKRNQAVINIANAEEQAETIAFIDREALLEKLRSIEDETAAYTASADAIGSVDEKKYAKQLAERAKYEAELAAMDRAAKAEAFTRDIELLNGQEQLDIQAAELSITNETELQNRKYQIALDFATKRLALMREEAMLDGVLTEQEIQNLQKVENTIKGLQSTLDNPDAPTVAEALGMSEGDFEAMQIGMQVAQQAISAVADIVSADAENRISQIDRRSQAEILSVEKGTDSEKVKAEKIAAIEKKAAMEKYKIDLQNFKISKGLQITNAIIGTAQAAIAAYSSGAAVPVAGIALGPAMAAIAAAFGAVQIGVIAAKQPPSPPAFASGGYVRGAGTGTSDSIDARLSNGESVNNAKTTSMFAPILSAMNKAGGGVDWYRGEGFSNGGIVKKFAAGGIAVSSSALMRENEQAATLQQTFMQSQPVLVLEEFQSVQGRQVRTEQNLSI